MSFRTRLLAAFVALSLLQAALFTLLSDQLLRDGIEGEAELRLSLVGGLFARELPESLWPPKKTGPAWRQGMAEEIGDYADTYGIDRATLILGETLVIDSRLGAPASGKPSDWWLSDGLSEPRVSGEARVSGPLFKSDDGWHKTLYLKMPESSRAWLRLEAGTPFLGAVATVQKRLLRLVMALVLPSLLVGMLLALALSRRVGQLSQGIEAAREGLSLPGGDEFARIANQVDGLLKNLRAEREQNERLLQGRISQARSLAFGVAHELRNPLAGLSLMTDLLRRKSVEGASSAELDEISQRILAEAGRLEHVVARFLDFARTPQLNTITVDLHELASASARGLEPKPEIWGEAEAKADAPSTTLIFSVLLGNACDSAGPQGRVSLRLSTSNGLSLAEVSDSGPAVGAEDRARLFTPFFTTKPKGLGLGLATAAGLADAMGGRLSLLEDGKTFQLELPEA